MTAQSDAKSTTPEEHEEKLMIESSSATDEFPLSTVIIIPFKNIFRFSFTDATSMMTEPANDHEAESMA